MLVMKGDNKVLVCIYFFWGWGSWLIYLHQYIYINVYTHDEILVKKSLLVEYSVMKFCVCYSHQGPIIFLQEFQNVCNPYYDCHFYISLRWRKFKFPATSCRPTVSTYGAGKWIKYISIPYPFILSLSLYFLTWSPF